MEDFKAGRVIKVNGKDFTISGSTPTTSSHYQEDSYEKQLSHTRAQSMAQDGSDPHSSAGPYSGGQ